MNSKRLFFLAVKHGYIEEVEEFIQTGMDINTRDMDSAFYPGTTALMQARDPEMVKKLLDFGADVHARDGEGRTVLFHCWGGESAKILLAAGADVNAKDDWDRTPLMYSASIDEKI